MNPITVNLKMYYMRDKLPDIFIMKRVSLQLLYK